MVWAPVLCQVTCLGRCTSKQREIPPLQNHWYRNIHSCSCRDIHWEPKEDMIIQRILLCFLLKFLSAAFFNAPVKISFPSMVNFFLLCLEGIECFPSPEWELCNWTGSKIVLKENYCGGCYYVWIVKVSICETKFV